MTRPLRSAVLDFQGEVNEKMFGYVGEKGEPNARTQTSLSDGCRLVWWAECGFGTDIFDNSLENVCNHMTSKVRILQLGQLLQFNYRLQNQTDFRLSLTFLSIMEDT